MHTIKQFPFFPLVCAIIITITPINLLSITIKTAVLTHPITHKTAVLLYDYHSSYITSIADKKGQKTHAKIREYQSELMANIAQNLIIANHDQNNNNHQTLVITEENYRSVGCLFEQAAGLVNVLCDDPSHVSTQLKQLYARIRNRNQIVNQESSRILSRTLLQHILSPEQDINAKGELFKKGIQTFHTKPTLLFTLNDQTHFILGDRNRGPEDAALVFTLYSNWESIAATFKKGEALPEELSQLTIDALQNYIETLQAEFSHYGLADTSYYQEINAVIKKALDTHAIAPTDHVALLHEHLVLTSQNQARNSFNNALLCFLSQKYDIELSDYINGFESNHDFAYLLLMGGGYHSNYVHNLLVSKGYILTHSAGVDLDDSYEQSLAQDKSTLTRLLETTYQNPPFVNIPNFIPIRDLAEISKQKQLEKSITYRSKALLATAKNRLHALF